VESPHVDEAIIRGKPSEFVYSILSPGSIGVFETVESHVLVPGAHGEIVVGPPRPILRNLLHDQWQFPVPTDLQIVGAEWKDRVYESIEKGQAQKGKEDFSSYAIPDISHGETLFFIS
jgi:hypothetical protein